MLQLGDLINVSYKNNEGIDVIAPESTKFIIYNIQYDKSSGQNNMTLYLAEV
jgi:hypothetical protein